MIKVGFISLGCSKNLVDTEVMLRRLHDAGFEITPDETEAEIIIINTCGFIESAKQESIDNILDAEKLLGITLTDSALMVPKKSITAIMGVKK